MPCFTFHSMPAFSCSVIYCLCFRPHNISRSLFCGLFIVVHIHFCQISFPLYLYEVSYFPLWFSQTFINIPSSLPVNERTNQRGGEKCREGEEDRLGLVHWWHCFLEWEPPDDTKPLAPVTGASAPPKGPLWTSILLPVFSQPAHLLTSYSVFVVWQAL